MKKFTTIVALILLLASCRDTDKKGRPLATTTSGLVSIGVDAALQPLALAEKEAFEAIYTHAQLDVHYTSENDAVEALLNDSVQLIVITRRLNPDELAVLENQKIVARELVVAREGVAVITHPANADSTITIDNLRHILRGTIDSWKQLNPASKLGKLQVVFGDPDAGIIRFLHDSVFAFQQLPPFFFAVDTDPAVVTHVSQNVDAMGMIGASWISDRDDATVNRFLETIRVAGLGNEDGEFYQPYQAYIAQGVYPLTRDVVMISREGRAGLASGFMAFVAGDKGQRVVLKAGLVPATMPVRVVEIDQKPLWNDKDNY